MLPGAGTLPAGLSLRPSQPSDAVFIESLHRSTREDLRMIDGSEDFIESLIDMQFHAQSRGYGEQFPNAMYFVIEKLGERVGRVTIDFGSNEIRLVDIAFIPAARGHGYGTHVLKALQMAAGKAAAPLVLSVLHVNLAARQLYERLGFRVSNIGPSHAEMTWYPTAEFLNA